MLIWSLIIIGAVLIDQITKILISVFLGREESLVIIDGVFRFTYVENEGAAFEMMDEHRWIFMVLSVIGIAAVLIYLWKFRPKSRFACVALSLIVGGGIGNMIDRVRLGYVIDFIDFYTFPNFWVWVFNAADSFICIGAGMIIVYLVADLVGEFRGARAKQKRLVANKAVAESADKSESVESAESAMSSTDTVDQTDSGDGNNGSNE